MSAIIKSASAIFYCDIRSSVDNFDFLIGVHHGSSVDFQWAEGRHKILYVAFNWSLLASLFLASFKLL
jgi:hypothetical protein